MGHQHTVGPLDAAPEWEPFYKVGKADRLSSFRRGSLSDSLWESPRKIGIADRSGADLPT
ncbi:MAG: hypothetical protein V2B13_02775 [Pseudomonadota bacterium]